MIKIAIFTTSRAEFGLLSNLVDAVIQAKDMNYLLFVGGSHHLKSQGSSITEIKKKGYTSIFFDFLEEEDSEAALTRSMGIELTQLAPLFNKFDFDYVVVLGDRIELLPIVQSAIIYCKPIIHLHGGEVTTGAMDDQVRHMITKAAHLHFCAADAYRQNILNMGEEAWRVHNVGALGADSMVGDDPLPKEDLFRFYEMDPNRPTAIMTYHPVTLEFNISAEQQIDNLFKALDQYPHQLIITAPNIDSGHEKLFEKIQAEVERKKDYIFIQSMGIQRYQSMLNYVEFVIGNSSSGILEAPFYKIPTINIGDRQKGRIRHPSIIDCDYVVDSIATAIGLATDSVFLSGLEDMEYQFGFGEAAEKIVRILRSVRIDQKLMQKQLEFPSA
jgi:GDP/UDP-N,N'-diacetylbacillosamine 2-epimerase (hydrolysing)